METTKLFTNANADSINELLKLDNESPIHFLSFCKVIAIAFESIHKIPYNSNTEESYKLLYGSLHLHFIEYLSHSKFYKIVNWDLVAKYVKINFNAESDCRIIVEHSEKINWDLIWKHQIVPEDAIREYYENSNGEFDDIKINWDLISEYQNLSNEFLAKYAEKINWDILLKSYNIPCFSFTTEYQKELLENNYRDPRPADFVNPDDFNILMTFKSHTNIEDIVRISVFS